MQTLELLAPARNLETGIAAIEHGADAVYIGASQFGARQAAGNSIDDIARLCRVAHTFGARIYCTVNTIIYEQELEATHQLLQQLRQAGVDAVLTQDMGIMGLTSLPLHASTQCDTRTPEKAQWLAAHGFSRVVLARELGVDEIRRIHEAVPHTELEAFVHGALCVSYSGVCYASQYCFNRSANRGACAQFCRMEFNLVDADGRVVEHNRHLLSLRDMCRIDYLEELADAGVCSFKIEGRLKDVAYVKNVVAAYSQRLNQLVAKRPDEFCRASRGVVHYNFTPNLKKTFNRGFTTYFLHGRKPDMASFDTPKALGECVGHVKELRRDSFNVAGTAAFANGDGLCFFNAEHKLQGFRVNRCAGNRLYPFHMPEGLKPGTVLYRNNDVRFEHEMQQLTAVRRIPLNMVYDVTPDGFRLSADGCTASVAFEHQQARKPQTDNLHTQLAKLGNTPYELRELSIKNHADEWFIPSSVLTDLRRQLVEQLGLKARQHMAEPAEPGQAAAGANAGNLQPWPKEYREYPYLFNIANSRAANFYRHEGIANVEPSMETATVPYRHPLIMQCRYCLRYELGHCVRRGGTPPTWREPLTLQLGDGRRFNLEFKCNQCEMFIYAQ